MKKSASRLFIAVALSTGIFAGCKARRAGNVPKNNPVPANPSNADSSGTSPSPKLTPAPVPNVRPNPIPNPEPPSPPL